MTRAASWSALRQQAVAALQEALPVVERGLVVATAAGRQAQAPEQPAQDAAGRLRARPGADGFDGGGFEVLVRHGCLAVPGHPDIVRRGLVR